MAFCVILLSTSFVDAFDICYGCYVRDFKKLDDTLISCQLISYTNLYCTPKSIQRNCNRQTIYTDGIVIRDNDFTLLPNLVEQTPNVRGVKMNLLNLSLIDISTRKNLCKWKHLQEVKMRNNLLRWLPKHFLSKCHHIDDLDLSRNAIAEISEEAFYNLLRLTSLDLSFNQLKTLHKYTFKPLNKLVILSLKGNQIQTIDVNLFYHNPALTALSLSNNDLRIIRSFQMLSEIRTLDLDNNQFLESVHLPVEANNLVVNVSNCNLRTLYIPPNVTRVDATNNRMSFIEINSDNQLKHLDLSKNILTDMNIISNMRSLQNLRLLNIMYNGFSDVFLTKLFHLRNLMVLAIDFNPKLHFLIAEMKKEMPSLSVIVISSHGWKSEEQMQMIKNAKRHGVRIIIHPNIFIPLNSHGCNVV